MVKLHPEEHCQCCESIMRLNYSAKSEVWSKVMRAPDGREASEKYHIVCVECFLRECELAGVKAEFVYFHGDQFDMISLK